MKRCFLLFVLFFFSLIHSQELAYRFINFSEKDMAFLNNSVLTDIYNNALSIMTNLNNATIFFGYEPAEDNDMTLFSLNKNNLV